jgi:hypothetical protein
VRVFSIIGLLAWYGMGIVRSTWGNELTVLHFPMGLQYLALPVGAVARSFGPMIYVVLPLAPLGAPVSALFQAATVGPLKTLVDRSPWTLVHLDQAGHPAGNSPVPPPVWLRSEDLTGIRGH